MAGLQEIVDILKSPKALALLTGAGAATQTEEAEAIFAGPKAKMADEFMLGIAGKMRAEGRPPKEIFQKTGWFKAPDGRWKFEIPDDTADFVKNYDQVIKDTMNPGKQSQVLDHPELYRNYPELADIDVTRVPRNLEDQGLRGSFTPPKYRMEVEDVGARHPVTGELLTEEMVGTPLETGKLQIGLGNGEGTARSTMLHENQHAVQDIEGWQGGASPDWFNQIEANKWKFKEDELRKKIGEIYDKRHMLAKQAQRTGDLQQKEALMAKRDALRPRLKQLQKLQDQIQEQIKINQPHGLYERIHGETEARAVQKRDALARALKNHPNNTTNMRDLEPVEQGAYGDTKEIIQKPEDSPAYKYKVGPAQKDIAQAHGEIYAPENPMLMRAGQFLNKVDTPFGNPVGGIAELLQHLGMYGIEGGNKYSEVEPQTGTDETIDKTMMAAIDLAPLAKRALPLAPAIAKLYELAKTGQE